MGGFSSTSCSTRRGCPTSDRGIAQTLWECAPHTKLRGLERGQEETMITIGALWRPVLSLEAWAGYTNTQRGALWQAIYKGGREICDLRRQHTADQREMQALKDHISVLE
ncbi:hypothetical protein Tco_0043174 [Tanacetum coccineum]